MNQQQVIVVKLLTKAEELKNSKNLTEYSIAQAELLDLSKRFVVAGQPKELKEETNE